MKLLFATLWGFARPIPDVLTFITPIFASGNDNYFIQESLSGKVVGFKGVFIGKESQKINCPIIVRIGDPEICGFEFSPDNIQMGTGYALKPRLIEYSQTLIDQESQTKNAITRFTEAVKDFDLGDDDLASRAIHIYYDDLQWKWRDNLETSKHLIELNMELVKAPSSIHPKSSYTLAETKEIHSSGLAFDLVDNTMQGTVIKVIGVGGAGGNAVQHMINKGMQGVEFIAANTDAQALAASKADNLIQIGSSGLGAGMRPEVGRKLAEETRSRIEDALRGAHLVFIAAGMGGGTGTGAAPVIAKIAKEMGALTVAVVSKPFSYEGRKCMEVAEAGLEELASNVDSLIIILNEKLEEIYEDDSMLEWFQRADDVLNNAVAGIAEIINVPGHINVDFNDVKTIMTEQGKAMMGTATASGVGRARIAAELAMSSPLLDDINLLGARGVLVNVTASRNLKGKEIKEIMSAIRAFAALDAIIAQGIAYDDAMGDNLRVTFIATGLGKTKTRVQLVKKPLPMASNGPAISKVTVGHAPPPQSGSSTFDGMKAPAVWRRESASEQVRALEKNGMETYDIPAFIRKQAE